MPQHLQADKLIATVQQLHSRVTERFPESGLLGLVGDLATITRQAAARVASIRRAHVPLRLATWSLSLGLIALIVYFISQGTFSLRSDAWDLLQGVEAGLSSMFFLGGAILFVVTLERRIQRRRALAAIGELRGLAHIIDMHQLDKDPERSFKQYAPTASSPRQPLSPFLLGRYLDYCSEMLSLISKVCVLYGQDFDDEVVLDAVDDIEDLAGGMSRRIWQKIVLLNDLEARAEKLGASEKVPAAATPHPLANVEIAGAKAAGDRLTA